VSAGDPVADALARARAFVDAHGSELDRARLAHFLGEKPVAEARAAVEAHQRADGAFEPIPGRDGAGPVAATLAGIEALLSLGTRRGSALERAVTFLARAQAPDGSWTDAPARAAERAPLTARVAAALARTPFARPALLQSAARFLEQHAPDAPREGGNPALLAGLAAFYANVPDERADEVLQRCGRELERGFRTAILPGGALESARVLLLCDAHGLPGANLTAEELGRALLAEQAPDGGWPAAGGDAARAAASVDAALALLRLRG
jgi:hypothetical protein